jgi:hypothetical protein
MLIEEIKKEQISEPRLQGVYGEDVLVKVRWPAQTRANGALESSSARSKRVTGSTIRPFSLLGSADTRKGRSQIIKSKKVVMSCTVYT